MLNKNARKQNQKKILIIHRYFWPENIAVLPLMLRNIVHIHVNAGHLVEVVCGSTNDNRAVWAKEFGNNVKVTSFDANIDRELSTSGRLFNCSRLALHGLKAIFFGGKRELVYLVSYPPGHAGVMLFFSILFRRSKQHLYYIQDNHEYMIGNRYFKRLYIWYTHTLVRFSTRVITLSESMKSQLLKDMKPAYREAASEAIQVVENYSTDLLPNSASEVKPVQSEKQIDIIYAGNHGKAQNLFHFLKLLSSVRVDHDLRIQFFGTGTEKPELMKYANELGLDIEFCDAVDRIAIAKYIAGAKLGLVAAQPGLMSFAFPSKLAAYNSAGTKALVMCEENGGLSDWLANNEIGFVINPTDLEIAVSQLEQLLTSDKISYSADEVIEKSHQLYSEDTYIAKMESCIQHLIPSCNK